MEYLPYNPIQKGYNTYLMVFAYGSSRKSILTLFKEFNEDVVVMLPSEENLTCGNSTFELRKAVLMSSFAYIDMNDDLFVIKNRATDQLGFMKEEDFFQIIRNFREQTAPLKRG
jgi:hypothetical protein